jgi:anti-anti-sigma factor
VDALGVAVHWRGHEAWVVLDGQLDVHGAPLLTTAVDGVLAGDCGRLVLDLKALTFVDAKGFSAVAAAYRKAAPRAIEFAVASPPRSFLRLAELLGLRSAFPITL